MRDWAVPSQASTFSHWVPSWAKLFLKPSIHYSRTWRIGNKIIFSSNKILLAKMRQMCCCTLFVVRRQFLRGGQFFFNEKICCVHRQDRYPDANPVYSVRWKTCSRNMANAFYTLFVVRHFFVVSPLFRCCLQIVYSRLQLQRKFHLF